MRKSITFALVAGFVFLLCATNQVAGQSTDALNSYSPYSSFGVGEIAKKGTAFNQSMGGIGVGVRDNRFINYMNPASIAARDTLSFMLDFGLKHEDIYSRDAYTKSAYNMFNMHHIVMTFPIYKKSAMMLGITPFSNVGYEFSRNETREDIIANVGDLRYVQAGQGSINKAFAALSATFFGHLSVGIQGNYYFGNIAKSSKVSTASSMYVFNTLFSGNEMHVSSFGAQAGLQFHGNVSSSTSFTVGGTYDIGSNFKGYSTVYAQSGDNPVYVESTEDTPIALPSEWSAGFSFRGKDKWMVGIDYTQSNWSKVAFEATPGVAFAPGVHRSINLGMELTPDRYNVRYFMRRWTYHLGAYYQQTYMMMNGNPVNAMGITFGFSVPVFRWYNSISFSVDLGQRGSLTKNLVQERYAMLLVNFSLHDIWFLKHRYD